MIPLKQIDYGNIYYAPIIVTSGNIGREALDRTGYKTWFQLHSYVPFLRIENRRRGAEYIAIAPKVRSRVLGWMEELVGLFKDSFRESKIKWKWELKCLSH